MRVSPVGGFGYRDDRAARLRKSRASAKGRETTTQREGDTRSSQLELNRGRVQRLFLAGYFADTAVTAGPAVQGTRQMAVKVSVNFGQGQAAIPYF